MYFFASDGTKQHGTYKDGSLTGHGLEISANNNYYSGGFLRGKRFGPGVSYTKGLGATFSLESQLTKNMFQDSVDVEKLHPFTQSNNLHFHLDGSVTSIYPRQVTNKANR